MPFEKGHKLNSRPKLWDAALRRAITQDDGKRVREAAEKLLNLASEGEMWAVRELADRLDGKPAQTIAGDADNPLELIARIERHIVTVVEHKV